MPKHRVVLTRYDEYDGDFRYGVDPIDQPGSPRVGRGKTLALALIDFFTANPKFEVEFIDETGEVDV